MQAGSCESTREVFEQREATLRASLVLRVLYQLPKCIHNTIDTECSVQEEKICFRTLINSVLSINISLSLFDGWQTQAFNLLILGAQPFWPRVFAKDRAPMQLSKGTEAIVKGHIKAKPKSTGQNP